MIQPSYIPMIFQFQRRTHNMNVMSVLLLGWTLWDPTTCGPVQLKAFFSTSYRETLKSKAVHHIYICIYIYKTVSRSNNNNTNDSRPIGKKQQLGPTPRRRNGIPSASPTRSSQLLWPRRPRRHGGCGARPGWKRATRSSGWRMVE